MTHPTILTRYNENLSTPPDLFVRKSVLYFIINHAIFEFEGLSYPSSSCISFEKDLIPMRFQWSVIAGPSRLKHCNSPAGAPLPWQRWMPPSCRRHRQRTRVDSRWFACETLPGHDQCTYIIYDYDLYIWLYIPRTQLTSIFEGQPSKTMPFPIKTRAMWVRGIHILKLSHIETNFSNRSKYAQ